ncbi:MAG: hypothetical protein ACE15C_02380 [Phycisphaerae bacterium]
MKNATSYEKKIRKLLSGMGKGPADEPPTGVDAFTFMLQAILESDAPRKEAQRAIQAFQREFVDYNELRVAPTKDIVDVIGRDFPGVREKAEAIVKALNTIFDRSSRLSMEYMHKMPKRELRKHLLEMGMTPYSAALVTMGVFSGHAVPVDKSLVIALKANGYVHPSSDLDDIQGFLERIVAQKDGPAAHELFRDFVEKNAKVVAKRLKEEAAAAAAAKAQAEAAARAAAAEAAKEKAKAQQAPAPAPQQAAKPAKAHKAAKIAAGRKRAGPAGKKA